MCSQITAWLAKDIITDQSVHQVSDINEDEDGNAIAERDITLHFQAGKMVNVLFEMLGFGSNFATALA